MCCGGLPTSLRTRFSSGFNSGSFGVDSFSAFLPSVSFFCLVFPLAGFEAESLGDCIPLAGLGVEELVNFIFIFLTDSERWGVCHGLSAGLRLYPKSGTKGASYIRLSLGLALLGWFLLLFRLVRINLIHVEHLRILIFVGFWRVGLLALLRRLCLRSLLFDGS